VALETRWAPDLGAEVTSLAFSWRIVRADGVALCFTSHDRDIYSDGLLYRSSPGVTPSAVMQSDRLDVDTMELTGAITADAISEEDLRVGRYDGAAVTFLVLDWLRPDSGATVLARGTIGQITMRDKGFVAELRSASQALDANVIELFSPECRADLGDKRCRVNLAVYSLLSRTIAAPGAPDDLAFSVADDLEAVDYYAYGSVRVLSGRNAGMSRQVVSSGVNSVSLRSPFPYTIDPGTLVLLRAGCDKLFATCIRKFGNALNFRGEPHVPGSDTVLQYKGL
jgi:uncharacterized phage protein (TIGR02218 family)